MSRGGPEAGPIVVWLWGEHDASTDRALCLTLAHAIALDSAALVLDLSEVNFMAVSTLGVIVRARDFLRQRSQSLMVRSPPAYVRRVIDACGLNDLLGPSPETAGDENGKALATWVAVPAAQRGDAQTAPSPWRRERVPVRAGGPLTWAPGAVSVEGLTKRR